MIDANRLADLSANSAEGGVTARIHFDELGPAHRVVVSCVNKGSRVLELGSATGYMTRALVESRGATVTAVEIDHEAYLEAASIADRAIEADLNEIDALDLGSDFDVVICADILEHLLDPEAALRSLASRLAPRGRVVVSIPNVANWSVRLELMLGHFRYTEMGILDRTHLHFYTEESFREMAGSCEYAVDAFRYVPDAFPLDRFFRGSRNAWRVKDAVNRLALKLWPRLFSYQFVATLVPLSGGR